MITSAPIPTGLGPFQTLFYKVADSLTLPINDIKNTVSADPAIIAMQEKLNKEKAEVATTIKNLEKEYTLPDFTCVGEYDEKKYDVLLPSVNIAAVGTEISIFEEIPNCDEAYYTILTKLEKLKKDLAAKFADLDKELLKLKELLPIMDSLLMLCPPQPPMILPNPIKFLTWIIKGLQVICNAIVTPYVQAIDRFYEFYRKCCNDTAVIIVKYLGPTKIKCITECPFKGRELECNIVIRNKWDQCKLKPAFNLVLSISSTIIGLIDLTLAPVNALFATFTLIIKPFKIVGIAPRTYPPQTMEVLVSTLKAKATTTSNVKITIMPPVFSQKA